MNKTHHEHETRHGETWCGRKLITVTTADVPTCIIKCREWEKRKSELEAKVRESTQKLYEEHFAKTGEWMPDKYGKMFCPAVEYGRLHAKPNYTTSGLCTVCGNALTNGKCYFINHSQGASA